MPKILLVEDNEMNRDMLSRRLSRNGFEVVIAVDGQQGIDAAEREQPDLILMDISLPVVDGWEATRRIRSSEAAKAIPIIALTAHAMKGDREKCLAAGMDEYLTKPLRARELFQTMERVLRDHSPHLWTKEESVADPAPGKADEAPGTSDSIEESPMQEEFDKAAALDRCGDDAGLLCELIDMFFTEVIVWMRDLKKAVEAGDAEKVQRGAHTIKGAVGAFEAHPTFAAALRVEMLGKEARAAQSKTLDSAMFKAEAMREYEALNVAIERLTAALKAYRQSCAG